MNLVISKLIKFIYNFPNNLLLNNISCQIIAVISNIKGEYATVALYTRALKRNVYRNEKYPWHLSFISFRTASISLHGYITERFIFHTGAAEKYELL